MKHIHWCQDVYPDLLPLFNVKLPSFLYKRLHTFSRRRMNRAHKIVVIGRCMLKRLAMTGVDRTNITVIPNWSHPGIFDPKNKEVALIQPKAQLPENMFRDDSPKFRVLYAGNIGKAHETDIFLNAAERLADHKEIEFVFVGSSQGHEKFAAERAKRGMDNIKFMPYQPQSHLRGVLESGDVHLVSMKESMAGFLVPCKFYGALAVGRPTIFVGPKKSEVGKVIEQHKAGLCVANNNVDDLVEAILFYRHNGDQWFAGQEGALEAGNIHNMTSSMALWDEVLEQVSGLA